MKENSELLHEFVNSEGKSRKMWKLLYTELLYNNSDLISDIIREINICLSENKNMDLILDIIDFCLVYGEKEIKTKVKIKESKMKKVLLMMGILFEEDIMVEII